MNRTREVHKLIGARSNLNKFGIVGKLVDCASKCTSSIFTFAYFLFVEKSKNTQKWPFLSLAGYSDSGKPGIKKFCMVGNQVGLCLIEWHQNQLNWPGQKCCSLSGKLMGPDGVIFRSGQNRGQSASIPTILVPKFWASDALKTLLWPLSPTSTKKKVIPEKHVFKPPPNTRFSHVWRARLTHASQKQLFSMRLSPMHNRAKFQPDRSILTKVLSFWIRF